MLRVVFHLALLTGIGSSAFAADGGGADPEVNRNFVNPELNVKEWLSKFEVESREVFKFRKKIVATAGLKKGESIADIGAGTGLYTFLFANAVGEKGKVMAVDISKAFLAHIEKQAKLKKRGNIVAVEGGNDSPNLPDASVDRIFICDTYHHFENPSAMLKAMRRALKPSGEVVLVEFIREEGKSSDWTLKHVRAGEKQVVTEFESAGFSVVRRSDFLKDNYILIFKLASTSLDGR
jgi:ubiquinone/menaquinone biosynthesis C-methylase UbiE